MNRRDYIAGFQCDCCRDDHNKARHRRRIKRRARQAWKKEARAAY